jgi:ATP-dependent helicase HrpB
VWRTHSSRGRSLDEAGFRKAVLAGYPDRVAQRRNETSPRVRLASGAGAVIGPESGVVGGQYLVALDVQSSLPLSVNAFAAGRHQPRSPQPAQTLPNDARIRVASVVDPEWLEATDSETVHRFDSEAGIVRAFEIERYDALILAERPTAVDPEIAAALLARAWLERGALGEDSRLLRRLRFAQVPVDLETLVRGAARAARSLTEIDLTRAVPAEVTRALQRDAPDAIRVPSGRMAALDYAEDGSIIASVKLQELFGLADTPKIGPLQVPVTFSLLAPNGRPVQVTRDLRSFWTRAYPEIRRELRGRYPKHPWPEDPWTAAPTARTTSRPPGHRFK